MDSIFDIVILGQRNVKEILYNHFSEHRRLKVFKSADGLDMMMRMRQHAKPLQPVRNIHLTMTAEESRDHDGSLSFQTYTKLQKGT